MLYINANTPKATVQLLSPDTVCVTMSRRMGWKPGQLAYLSIPAISAFPFEAHPFTIAGLPDDADEEESKVGSTLHSARPIRT